MSVSSRPRIQRAPIASVYFPCFRGWLVPLAAFLVALLATPASAWDAPVETRDGVPHVMNPSAPRDGAQTVALEKLWELGGESELEDEFFGVIGTVLSDEDGNVYLLDTQLAEIKVFDAQGQYLRTIGREGEGPGEFRRPQTMFFLPWGDLGVLQMGPAGVSTLTRGGEPGKGFAPEDLRSSGMASTRRAAVAGDRVILEVNQMSRQPGKMIRKAVLASYDPEGSRVATFMERESTIDFAKPVFREGGGGIPPWLVDPSGRIHLVSPEGKYEVTVMAPDGSPERVIAVDSTRRPRSGSEIEDLRSRMIIRGIPNPEILVDEIAPAIRDLFLGGDGALWVASDPANHDLPSGTLGVFDVFDPDGRFVRRVTLKGEGTLEGDRLFFQGDRLYVIRHFADAMQSMLAGMRGGNTSPEESEEEPEPIKIIAYRLP